MITIRNLHFSWPASEFELRIPALDIAAGSSAAITGPSGSGKTTLLNIIAGILPAIGGSVKVGDTDLAQLPREFHRIDRAGPDARDHDVEFTGPLQSLDGLGSVRYASEIGYLAEVEILELAEQRILDLAFFGKDERVVEARDQEDPLDAIQHDVLKTAEVRFRRCVPDSTRVDCHGIIEPLCARAHQTCLVSTGQRIPAWGYTTP